MYSDEKKFPPQNLRKKQKPREFITYQACIERNIKGSSVSGRMTLNKTMEMSEWLKNTELTTPSFVSPLHPERALSTKHFSYFNSFIWETRTILFVCYI